MDEPVLIDHLNARAPAFIKILGGTIVAVGPGRLLDSGNRGDMTVTVGDTVIYGKYGGSDIEVDGQEMKILRESDILAKIL